MNSKDLVAWLELETRYTFELMVSPAQWRPLAINAQSLRIKMAVQATKLVLETAPAVEQMPILEAVKALREVFELFRDKAKDQVEAVWLS